MLKKQRRKLGYHYDTWCSGCKAYVGKMAVKNGGGAKTFVCDICSELLKVKEKEDKDKDERLREESRLLQEKYDRVCKEWEEKERTRVEGNRKEYLENRPQYFSMDMFKKLLLQVTKESYPNMWEYIDIERMFSDIENDIKNLGEQHIEYVSEYIRSKWYPQHGSLVDDLKISGYPSDDPFPLDYRYFARPYLYSDLSCPRQG